ncbi:MAG: hypothetical protein JNL14_15990 [Devosia sp.]|uniref:hypothetical protein n=1 Tax=Devosia sp. TaxID=1871048 RepID=UPI001A367665|nr:hypothetical protein [Devosia sp.]MBL8599234.1 hypothetical protein [Devosia sp.]
MREKGLYRFTRPASGEEVAMVSFGREQGSHDIERGKYEQRGYFPRFTMLPTKDEFDQRQKRTPLSGRIVRGD